MTSKLKYGKKEKQKLSSNMIIEVYEHNFREEIEKLSFRLEKYKFIAMVF